MLAAARITVEAEQHAAKDMTAQVRWYLPPFLDVRLNGAKCRAVSRQIDQILFSSFVLPVCWGEKGPHFNSQAACWDGSRAWDSVGEYRP